MKNCNDSEYYGLTIHLAAVPLCLVCFTDSLFIMSVRMPDEILPLQQLLREDNRYPLEAYVFLREALAYASDILHLGSDAPLEPELEISASPSSGTAERHLTGQELCQAIRLYAVKQFGYMAKTVLNHWGINSTSDFGNIVYNMIGVGLMKKSSDDRRTHFDDVYDFDDVFEKQFEMKQS